jgi:hypothetical protein
METKISPSLQEKLKRISIRGRMALAITCLDMILTDRKVDSVEKLSLLDIFWQFVENEEENLAKWDQDRRQHDLLMDLTNYAGGWTSEKPTKYSFAELDDWIYQVIFEVDELGLGELYSAVQGFSNNTLENLTAILNLIVEHGYTIPSLEPFLRSPFDDTSKWGVKGWGKPSPRTFYDDRNNF